MGVLLAACAGATDALAFFGLGKAFAGIVTGNLVTAGYGVATGSTALVKPTVTAVTGSIVGEITWARLLRRPRASDLLLIAELGLFLLTLAGWLAAGSHPAGLSVLALRALVSVALGGQSIWALRIHQTTTYFTGMLTKTISMAGSGAKASIGGSIRQLGALVAGLNNGGEHDLLEELRQQNTELVKTLVELRLRQEELARLNRELEDTNRGVVALYAELDERADHLRRADEVKTRFLSNMTHEFRTPLNSIQALTRLLLDGMDGSLTPEQERQVRSRDLTWRLQVLSPDTPLGDDAAHAATQAKAKAALERVYPRPLPWPALSNHFLPLWPAET